MRSESSASNSEYEMVMSGGQPPAPDDSSDEDTSKSIRTLHATIMHHPAGEERQAVSLRNVASLLYGCVKSGTLSQY